MKEYTHHNCIKPILTQRRTRQALDYLNRRGETSEQYQDG